MDPQHLLPGVLLWRGHKRRGPEWWLFHADLDVVPFEPARWANGRPDLSALPPRAGTAGWCVMFSPRIQCGLPAQPAAASTQTLAPRARKSLAGFSGLPVTRPAAWAVTSNTERAAAPVRRARAHSCSHCRCASGWAGFLVVNGPTPSRLEQQFRTLDLKGRAVLFQDRRACSR